MFVTQSWLYHSDCSRETNDWRASTRHLAKIGVPEAYHGTDNSHEQFAGHTDVQVCWKVMQHLEVMVVSVATVSSQQLHALALGHPKMRSQTPPSAVEASQGALGAPHRLLPKTASLPGMGGRHALSAKASRPLVSREMRSQGRDCSITSSRS